jgi:hypothetical protein
MINEFGSDEIATWSVHCLGVGRNPYERIGWERGSKPWRDTAIASKEGQICYIG